MLLVHSQNKNHHNIFATINNFWNTQSRVLKQNLKQEAQITATMVEYSIEIALWKFIPLLRINQI